MIPDIDALPPSSKLPRHVAIIMDGNGRWATRRRLPRIAGHRAGVEAVRRVVQACGEKGIEALTLFAFSSENWRRPREEVGLLMNLFVSALEQEVKKLDENQVRLRVIGEAEQLTADNQGLSLVIAANYGGRWDLTQAMRHLARRVERGEIGVEEIGPKMIQSSLCLSELPEPDLFIRTGGEKRVSNFLLWQLAYTELYFTDALWPDFDRQAFEAALASYTSRQRRFGRTGEQVLRAQG